MLPRLRLLSPTELREEVAGDSLLKNEAGRESSVVSRGELLLSTGGERRHGFLDPRLGLLLLAASLSKARFDEDSALRLLSASLSKVRSFDIASFSFAFGIEPLGFLSFSSCFAELLFFLSL